MCVCVCVCGRLTCCVLKVFKTVIFLFTFMKEGHIQGEVEKETEMVTQKMKLQTERKEGM